MKLKRLQPAALACALLVIFIAGCGGAEPTATPIPPTTVPTALPPTVGPTQAATRAVPAGGGSNPPLEAALVKTKGATAYHVDLSVTGQGNFAATGGPTPAANEADKVITLLGMQGDVNGKDAHYAIQGQLTQLLGLAPDTSFEVISAGGDAYVQGPVPMLGATETKWYKLPANAAQVAQPPLTPGSFLDSFGDTGINPADFKSAGTETLDTQSCDVFAGDKTAVVNAFSRLSGATGATQEDLDSIDNAEFKFWVCGDGYLHQVRMLIQGHDKAKPDQKGSFQVAMKLTNFGSATAITPPPDALPLQIPQQGAPEATPTP